MSGLGDEAVEAADRRVEGTSKGAIEACVGSYQTLAEVAAEWRFTPRRLRDIIKRHGILVFRAGRDFRFDDAAKRALEEALRTAPRLAEESFRERSRFRAASAAAMKERIAVRRDAGTAYARALALTTVPSRTKKRPSSMPGAGETRVKADAAPSKPREQDGDYEAHFMEAEDQ